MLSYSTKCVPTAAAEDVRPIRSVTHEMPRGQSVMPLAVVIDGRAVEVTDPWRLRLIESILEITETRALRMMAAIASRAGRIGLIEQGDVRLHFGKGNNRVRVWLTEADSE